MARAYLCLPWPSLFLLFWLLFCSISSIQVSFSEWIVVARAASVFDGRSPTLELTEATRDRSKARSNIGGDDAPPWHNVTVVFSFSIAPSSASYLGTRLHARALSFHCSGSYRPALFRHAGPSTLAMNTTAAMGIFSVATVAALDWCRLAWSHGRPGGVSSSATCRGSSITKRRAILISDVDSSRIQDYSLGEEQQLSNSSTDFLSPIFTWFQDQAIEIGLSLTETSRNISFACNDSAAASLKFPSLLQGHTNIRVDRAGISYRRRRLRDEPTARRLLTRAYGRRSARKKHVAVATRGQVASSSSWLAQAYVAGLAFFGLICAVVAGLILLCCIRGKGPRQSTAAVELEDDGEPTTIREPQVNRRLLGPRMFNYCQLAAVTDDFAEERKIGRGGFGPVYRGYLSEEDRHVAIKVLSQDQSVQGLKEFEAEVTIVSQLRHRSIIQLIGWSESRRGGPALVYEFMPGGSLDAHLYSPDTHLTWSQRHKIALALGSALRYLHADCDQCVVHGDIKPANVMLDASGNAKLGDFGLARLVDHGAEPQTTQVVAGTVGYIDPEFINSRRPSTESDVYSFGVVLLEIACGRRPASSSRQAGQAQASAAALLAFAREMYRRNMVLDAADRRLEGVFDGLQMERLLVTGLWCAQQDPIRRPSITQAMDVLRSEDAKLPVLPRMSAGSGQVQSLERVAYGDLSEDNSVSLSDVTAYFTDEESNYLIVQEE